MMARTFKGQQLSTLCINGAGYDAKTGMINVYVYFNPAGEETRLSFEFIFSTNGQLIIERFDADS